MKHCHTCGRDLEPSYFGKNRCKKDGLQAQCNECRRVTNNKYYKESEIRRATVRRNDAVRFLAIKEYIASIKASGCIICGETTLCALDFHHTSNNKLDNIATLVANKGNFSKIVAEVEKCVVLCANCHRKVHAGILEVVDGSPSNQTLS